MYSVSITRIYFTATYFLLGLQHHLEIEAIAEFLVTLKGAQLIQIRYLDTFPFTITTMIMKIIENTIKDMTMKVEYIFPIQQFSAEILLKILFC